MDSLKIDLHAHTVRPQGAEAQQWIASHARCRASSTGGNPRAHCQTIARCTTRQPSRGRCDYVCLVLCRRLDGSKLLTPQHQQSDAQHSSRHQMIGTMRPFCRGSDYKHKDCFGAGQEWEVSAPVQAVEAAVVTA